MAKKHVTKNLVKVDSHQFMALHLRVMPLLLRKKRASDRSAGVGCSTECRGRLRGVRTKIEAGSALRFSRSGDRSIFGRVYLGGIIDGPMGALSKADVVYFRRRSALDEKLRYPLRKLLTEDIELTDWEKLLKK